MGFDEYQSLAARTFSPDMLNDSEKTILNGVMGLNGEAGECIDIVKKHLFQGHELDREHLIEEIGDVMWYIAALATGLDVELETVAWKNINKLQERYPFGFEVNRSINREE